LLDPATRERLHMLTGYFEAHGMSDPAAAQHEAVITIGRTIELQANYFAYGDAFALLGCGMVVAVVATLFLRRPAGAAAPGAH
jgi:DHA2 family multidrug resistance protein